MHIAILRTKKQSIQKTLAQIFFTVVGMLVYVHFEGYASWVAVKDAGVAHTCIFVPNALTFSFSVNM